MSEVLIRAPEEEDWEALLELADAALPWDARGNREWLANRQRFEGRRRHYLVFAGQGDAAAGYGAIEEGPDEGSFRIFVVMEGALLESDVGIGLYEQLEADLMALGATGVWAREYGADVALLGFLERRGFVERSRFTPEGYGEMVVLAKRLLSAQPY